MIVNISNRQRVLSLSKEQTIKLIETVILGENRTADEVNLYLVDTPTICKLHLDFFNDPSQTDCISFPMDDNDSPAYRILGEVFVCPATAKKYAKENQKDPYEETALYIIHGLLHLMGYDDVEEADILLMRSAEEKYLRLMKNLCIDLRKNPAA